MSNQVTNGEHWRNGKLYVWCGNTAVQIRKLDAKGEPVKEPAKEA